MYGRRYLYMVKKIATSLIILFFYFIATSSFAEEEALVIFPKEWGDSWTSMVPSNNPYYYPSKQDYIDLVYAFIERARAFTIYDGPMINQDFHSPYGIQPDIVGFHRESENDDIEALYWELFKIKRKDPNLPFDETNYEDLFPDPQWNGQEYVLEYLSFWIERFVPYFIDNEISLSEFLSKKLEGLSPLDIPLQYTEWRLSGDLEDWSSIYNCKFNYRVNDPIQLGGHCFPTYNPKKFFKSIGLEGSDIISSTPLLCKDGTSFPNHRMAYGFEFSESNDVEIMNLMYIGKDIDISIWGIYQKYIPDWLWWTAVPSNGWIDLDYYYYPYPLRMPLRSFSYEKFEIVSADGKQYSFSIPFLALNFDKPRSNNILSIESLYDIYSGEIYTASGTTPWVCPSNILPLCVYENNYNIDNHTNIGNSIKGRYINTKSYGYPLSAIISMVNHHNDDIFYVHKVNDRWEYNTNGYFVDKNVSWTFIPGLTSADKWPKMLTIKKALSKLVSIPISSKLTARRDIFYNSSVDPNWSIETNNLYLSFPYYSSRVPFTEQEIGHSVKTILSGGGGYESIRGATTYFKGLTAHLGYSNYISRSILNSIKSLTTVYAGPYTPNLLYCEESYFFPILPGKSSFREAATDNISYNINNISDFDIRTDENYSLKSYYLVSENTPIINGLSWLQNHLDPPFHTSIENEDGTTWSRGDYHGYVTLSSFVTFDFDLD